MSRLRTLWCVAAVTAAIFFASVPSALALSPEEEHRLVMKADASVIDEKLNDMPFGVLMAPAPMDEHSLPMPTMDPPLPASAPKHNVKITTASVLQPNKGALSDRIRNAMKTMKERMKTLQSSRRPPAKKPVEVPKFPRPSSLVSSNPSDLEVAMKRIEIMASRAGFNMSSMPRRTQLQIVSRLAPKLPSKMSTMVGEEMESMSGKLYQYLPEPARDPLIEDDQAFLHHFMDQFDQPHTETDEFYKEVNSHSSGPTHESTQQKLTSFDVSQVSLTDDPANEPFTLDDVITSPHQISSSASTATGVKFVETPPNVHLMPPKFDAGEGTLAASTYTHESDDVPKPSALISQYPTHHVEEVDPLVTLSSEVHARSMNNASRGTKAFKVGSVKSYGVTASPPTKASPTRQAPTRLPPTVSTTPDSIEEVSTVSVPPKPIRVSVITKDSILVDDTADDGNSGSVRTIKYVHVEPLPSTRAPSELSPFDKFLPTETKEVKINPKEILVNIDKANLAMDTYALESPKEPEVPAEVLTSEEPPTEDPYPLTDEEIAATVAELKKYEAEIAGLGQGENSLEVDYPYRLTPHPLEYPDHPDHPQPSSLEDDSDLVTRLDELLAEFKNIKPTEGTKTSASTSSASKVMAKIVPSAIPPHLMGHGHRRPHPLLKHRPPLRPGLGRPIMMGSRLRPMIHRPPAGFPRPGGVNSPPRINEVTVSQLPQKFNKECDYFSDELCLLVQDYPIEAITEAMDQNPSVSSALLAKEPAHNQKSSSYIDGLPETTVEGPEGENAKHPDFTGEGGFLCPSKVAYGKIKKAKSSTSGDWKFIVNYADKSQTLRLEKCLQPGDSCSYIMPHFRTACTQVYNYHRLLAWDSEKGLHSDVFKVPTCCTCHVLGYYVPGSKKSLPQSPAMPSMRRRDHMGPRFMGPPRGRRISPHMHHMRKPMHPMMMMLPQHSTPVVSPLNAVPPTQIASASAAPSANATTAANDGDEVLRSLLLQYASLREKITKLKDTKASPSSSPTTISSSSLQSKRSSKMYSHWPRDIIKALRKRKRQSTISQKNNKMKKPSPEMLKKLKNLLADSSKLDKNPKLKAKIHRYLRRMKNAQKSSSSSSVGRRGRNMKIKLTTTASDATKLQKIAKKKSPGKAEAKKRLMILLSAAKKKLQEDKAARVSTPPAVPFSPPSPSNPNRLRLPPSQSPRNRQLGGPLLSSRRQHQNYESHPIWNYFHKLQGGSSHPPSSRARRLRRLF